MLNDFNVTRRFQEFGQAVADVAAARNHHPSPQILIRAEQAQNLRHVFGAGQHIDFIAFNDGGVLLWND